MPNSWIKAVNEYNSKNKSAVFVIPKKGTQAYNQVKALQKKHK